MPPSSPSSHSDSEVHGMVFFEHTDDDGHRLAYYDGRLSVYGKPSMTADDGTVAVGVDWPDPDHLRGAVGRYVADQTENGDPLVLDTATDPARVVCSCRFDHDAETVASVLNVRLPLAQQPRALGALLPALEVFPVNETFHVGLSERSTEPLPVTFYVSPEILEDEDAVPDERLAALLLPDLEFAIYHLRQRRRQERSA